VYFVRHRMHSQQHRILKAYELSANMDICNEIYISKFSTIHNTLANTSDMIVIDQCMTVQTQM
jgi:hypothetical protein